MKREKKNDNNLNADDDVKKKKVFNHYSLQVNGLD